MAVIHDLLSYRLHRVANLVSRGAELRYRREFAVSLWEWRAIALLGAATEPSSLNDLARAAGIHKSQMSRVVAGLIKRRLLLSTTNALDARCVQLSLTKTGRKTYVGLMKAAGQRDVAFWSCLTTDERAIFDQVLMKLSNKARELNRSEALKK